MMDENKFIWTDWHVAELKRRVENREPAQSIATSWGISKSAVLGKGKRLGVKFDANGQADLKKTLRALRAAGFVVRRGKVVQPKPEKPKIAKPVAAALPEPEPAVFTPRTTPLVSIMELKNGVCCFPIGDPRDDDFGYCGAKVPEDLSGPYCCEHRLIAYTGKPSSDPKPAFWLKPIGASCMLGEAAE